MFQGLRLRFVLLSRSKSFKAFWWTHLCAPFSRSTFGLCIYDFFSMVKFQFLVQFPLSHAYSYNPFVLICYIHFLYDLLFLFLSPHNQRLLFTCVLSIFHWYNLSLWHYFVLLLKEIQLPFSEPWSGHLCNVLSFLLNISIELGFFVVIMVTGYSNKSLFVLVYIYSSSLYCSIPTVFNVCESSSSFSYCNVTSWV